MTTKPYVICLMMTSLDGKILSDAWGNDPRIQRLRGKFEETHEKIGVPAWIVGRTTMEKDFTHFQAPILSQNTKSLGREDFVAGSNAPSFAIAIDSQGKLGWKSDTMHGDHVITILTEKVSDAYLHHLREIGLSYIFAGKDSIDLPVALHKLRTLFNIEKLMLEGGGHINGSFLNEGLVDEFHQLLLPVVDGRKDTPSVFEISDKKRKKDSILFKLRECQQIDDDVLWLTYAADH